MAGKAVPPQLFPIVSLAVGLGLMIWVDLSSVPFMGLLAGPPDTNSLPTYGIPALLAGLFGFLRAKPKEVWIYGLLMWMPRAIRLGTAWLIHPGGWLRGLALVIVASSLLAAVLGIVASYAGVVLHKLYDRIAATPDNPASLLGE